MSNKIVRSAIEPLLKSYSTSKNIPISWENVKFTPPLSGKWLEAKLRPFPVQDPSIGAYHRRFTGEYQVNIVFPNDGGMGEIDTMAQEIADIFPRGLKITKAGNTVHITNSPNIVGSFIDGKNVVIPIYVRYRLDVVTLL